MLEAVQSNKELHDQALNLYKTFTEMMDELAAGK
jgi:hypothetical protein